MDNMDFNEAEWLICPHPALMLTHLQHRLERWLIQCQKGRWCQRGMVLPPLALPPCGRGRRGKSINGHTAP